MRARSLLRLAPLPLLAFACATLALPGEAHAKKKKKHAETEERFYEFSAGAKGALGGGLYSAPTGTSDTGLGFTGGAGGIGWGVGAYFEARFVKYLGLELGIGYDTQEFHRKVTFNGTTDVTESVTAKGIRIPILLKGIVPTPFGRMSLGIGPEIVSAMSPSAKLDYPSNVTTVPTIAAEKVGNARLALDFQMAFDLPEGLEIPFNLHASKSLGQPDAWKDRVSGDLAANSYTVKAETTWDFRMSLGLGYRF